MSVLENVTNLYAQISQGDMLGALDNFYADNVEITEAMGEVRNGKEAQAAAVKEWQSGIQEVHGAGQTAITANEETGHAIVETWIDITMKNGHRMKMEQCAVQTWENGKIVKERFYYDTFPMRQGS